MYVLAPYPLLKFWPLFGKDKPDHMQTLEISLFSSWLKSQSKWSNHSRIRVTTLNSFNNVCAPLSSVPENIQREISSPSQMSPLSSKRWLNLGDLDKKNPWFHFYPSPGYLMFLPISCLSTGLATEIPEKLRIKIQENAILTVSSNHVQSLKRARVGRKYSPDMFQNLHQ